MSAVLKPVRARLILTDERYFGTEYLDVTSTFNMTERRFMDRNEDMCVGLANGTRVRVAKKIVVAVKELKMVGQETLVV